MLHREHKIVLLKISIKGRCMNNENDISAEETFQSKSSWIQSKNEHTGRKKSISCQKSKRKKTVISIGRVYVAFSSIKKGAENESFTVTEKK